MRHGLVVGVHRNTYDFFIFRKGHDHENTTLHRYSRNKRNVLPDAEMVNVPAKEEVGHWEEDGYWWSDVVYRCNQCGETFTTKDALFVHEGDLSTCWSYTEVPGESYWVKTGQHWVVDEPAQEEQGHWEYR